MEEGLCPHAPLLCHRHGLSVDHYDVLSRHSLEGLSLVHVRLCHRLYDLHLFQMMWGIHIQVVAVPTVLVDEVGQEGMVVEEAAVAAWRREGWVS
jgi:hypothetical protein